MLGGTGAPAGRSGAGGLADALGAAFGGGRGAQGGSALAVLGGLAISALSQMQAAAPAPEQTRAVTGSDAERLVLRAMIAAMKADGRLDDAERATLTRHLSADGVTGEEVAFVNAELARPLDPGDIAAEAREPALAAQVYAASIVAIEIDEESERVYLRALARALRLSPETVARLHRMTGAPPV